LPEIFVLKALLAEGVIDRQLCEGSWRRIKGFFGGGIEGFPRKRIDRNKPHYMADE